MEFYGLSRKETARIVQVPLLSPDVGSWAMEKLQEFLMQEDRPHRFGARVV